MLLKEINVEFKRGITDKKFWVCILIGIFLALFHYIQIVLPQYSANEREMFSENLYPVSTFEVWMGARGGLQESIYYVIVPLLAVLPYTSSLFFDIKSGYIGNVLVRTSKRAYFLSKIIVSVFLGSITSIFPMALSLYLTAMTVPSFIPEVTQQIFPAINMRCMFHDIFYTNPYVYTFLYLGIIFLVMSMFIVLSLILAFYAGNSLEVIIFPFIIYIFIDFIFAYFGAAQFSLKQIIQINQSMDISGVIAAGELLVFIPMLILIYIQKAKKYESI